jgi:hypothetical protein
MSQVDFEQRLIELAFFYGHDATDDQIRVWAQFLVERITLDQLNIAIKAYCEDSSNEWFPRPMAKLVDLIHPKVNADSQAKLIAGRVVEAVSKFGWINSQKAKEFIGPKGWAAVKAYGDWSYICENLGVNISMGQFQAQIRDHAKAQIQSGVTGYNDNQLEHSGGNHRLNDVINKLTNNMELEK